MHYAGLLGHRLRETNALGWALGDHADVGKSHDWRTLVRNVGDYIKGLNFNYKVRRRREEQHGKGGRSAAVGVGQRVADGRAGGLGADWAAGQGSRLSSGSGSSNGWLMTNMRMMPDTDADAAADRSPPRRLSVVCLLRPTAARKLFSTRAWSTSTRTPRFWTLTR